MFHTMLLTLGGFLSSGGERNRVSPAPYVFRSVFNFGFDVQKTRNAGSVRLFAMASLACIVSFI